MNDLKVMGVAGIIEVHVEYHQCPGKLCMAMGIDRTLYGADLCRDILYVVESQPPLESEIIKTPRIEVDYAGEASQYPRRFLLADCPFVSKKPK